MTEYALFCTKKAAKKVGLTLRQVAELCLENGWAGFKAHYLENMKRREKHEADKYKTFAEREHEFYAKRYAEMRGDIVEESVEEKELGVFDRAFIALEREREQQNDYYLDWREA